MLTSMVVVVHEDYDLPPPNGLLRWRDGRATGVS